MTKLVRCIAVTVIGAAIVTATPAVALHGGGLRMGRQVFAAGAPLANRHFVGRFHDPAFFRHHRHFRNFALVGGRFFYGYLGYGNYCWQQVWTPYGWQWLDACSGYYGYYGYYGYGY